MKKKVFFIGAGPGDPLLITLKGKIILETAQVILYDYLVNKDILDIFCKDSVKICVDRGKKFKDGYCKKWEETLSVLEDVVKKYNRIVRLKNGDPGIYGRTYQEIEFFKKNNFEVEIIPGISSGLAIEWSLSLPLTERKTSSCLIILTGHNCKESKGIEWEKIGKIENATILIYMGVENVSFWSEQLIKAGMDKKTLCGIITDVSLPSEKILIGNIGNIREKVKNYEINPPAIFIIGKILKYFKKNENNILFTGINPFNYFWDGKIYWYPLIKVEEIKSEFKKDLSKFDFIIFKSPRSVDFFIKKLLKSGMDTRYIRGKIIAIGKETQNRLFEKGLISDILPNEESSYGVIEKLKQMDIKNKKFLIIGSNIGKKNNIIEEYLRKKNAKFYNFSAYKVKENIKEKIDLKNFYKIYFTSPSTIRSFFKIYKKIPYEIKFKFRGKKTKEEFERCKKLIG